MATKDNQPDPIVDGEGNATKAESAKSDAGRGQAQQRMDVINEQGFRGVAVDPTPNENYTVSGVTAGAPTPETDVEAEKAASGPVGPLSAQEAADEAATKVRDAKG